MVTDLFTPCFHTYTKCSSCFPSIIKVSHSVKCNLNKLKILLIHFNSSVALNAFLLTEKQGEISSLAGIASLG